MIPPGFRFYPTEEELVGFYLSEKLKGRRNNQLQHLIPDLDIYNHDPWDLPQLSGVQCQQDPQLQQWFFFVRRPEKEARGGRPNRLTDIGHWKAAGTSGYVYLSDKRVVIGEKRTMVFYKGRATRAPGSKTDWKMNEYRAIQHGDTQPLVRFEFSLCRVYIRSKCIRSFDRRPSSSSSVARAIRQRPPTPPIITSSHSHDQQLKLQNPPTDMMTKDTSGCTRDNLSSSDDGHDQNFTKEDHMNQATQHDGSWLSIIHKEVNVDDMPLWEWDDQFFDSHQLII